MGQGGWPALLGWMLAAAALSAFLTVLAIRYARRRRMLDQPGQRRSHAVPTPRGGGIAIVAAILACAVAPVLLGPESPADVGTISLRSGVIVSTAALLIVALAGWIDDRRGLSARLRFGDHCLAGLVLLSPLVPDIAMLWQLDAGPPPPAGIAMGVGFMLLFVLSIAWSINLHNFMDGINGLLACQAIFVFVALGSFGLLSGTGDGWSVSLLLAAAVSGFVPFNFPRARIFMGDVGSGTLGLLIALVVLSLLADQRLDPAIGLVACSAFIVDATATLLSRMLRGRRWYSAHREHLYQWLVRSGFRHAGVVGLYMAWNVVVALPAMLLIQSGKSSMASTPSPQFIVSPLGIAVLLVVYALGVAVWVLSKRWCVARVRGGSSHGFA